LFGSFVRREVHVQVDMDARNSSNESRYPLLFDGIEPDYEFTYHCVHVSLRIRICHHRACAEMVLFSATPATLS